MKKSIETAFFDEQWKLLYASFTAYLKHQKHEDLHTFRVQVKKIRAFLILSDSTTSSTLQRYFKPVKKIFGKAGLIRNAYISLGKSEEEQESGKKTRKQLRRKMKKAIHRFKAAGAAGKEQLKQVARQIRRHIHPVAVQPANLFYRRQLRLVAGILETSASEEQLHDCRKMLKILIYNYIWASEILDVRLNVAYLAKLEDAIGKWHDQVSAARQMQKTGKQDRQNALRAHVAGLGWDFYEKATGVKTNKPLITTSFEPHFMLN